MSLWNTILNLSTVFTSVGQDGTCGGRRQRKWRSEWETRAGNRLHWGDNPEVMLKWGRGEERNERDIRASQGHWLRGGHTAEAVLGSQEETTCLGGFCESGVSYDRQMWSMGRKRYLKIKQNQESNNQRRARCCGGWEVAGLEHWVECRTQPRSLPGVLQNSFCSY